MTSDIIPRLIKKILSIWASNRSQDYFERISSSISNVQVVQWFLTLNIIHQITCDILDPHLESYTFQPYVKQISMSKWGYIYDKTTEKPFFFTFIVQLNMNQLVIRITKSSYVSFVKRVLSELKNTLNLIPSRIIYNRCL